MKLLRVAMQNDGFDWKQGEGHCLKRKLQNMNYDMLAAKTHIFVSNQLFGVCWQNTKIIVVTVKECKENNHKIIS